VNLKKGEWDPEGDTLTAYCWVVWIKGDRLINGDTLLMWIPPGQRVALTRPDDIERFTAHPVRAPNSPEIPDSSNSPAVVAGDAGEADADTASPAHSFPHAASGTPVTFAAATPILQARYATEDGQALADELGVPIGTLRTWAFRLKLTRKGRIGEMNIARLVAATAATRSGEASDA